MPTLNLQTVTPASVSTAEGLLISGIRDTHPQVDVRPGTAGRDYIVNPAATAFAAVTDYVEALRLSVDLEAAAAGNIEDPMVTSLLGNLGVSRRNGSSAIGLVRIVFATKPRPFVVPAAYRFTSPTGVVLTVPSELEVGTAGGRPLVELVSDGARTWAADVPVVAAAPGAAGNLPDGTPLTAAFAVTPGSAAQYVFGNLQGGGDPETIAQAAARVRGTISLPALSSPAAIASVATSLAPTVTSVEVIGAADPELRRNRRNPFGWAVGSAVDVYLRDFFSPTRVNVTRVTFRYLGNRSYQARIHAPGALRVNGVTFVGETTDAGGVIVDWTSVASPDSPAHRRLLDEDVHGSIYQDYDIVLRSVPAVIQNGLAVYPVERLFDVGLDAAASVEPLQTYVDAQDTGAVGQDLLLRAPYFVGVELSLTVGRSRRGEIDEQGVKDALLQVVNRKPLGSTLTSAEISAAVLAAGYPVVTDVRMLGTLRVSGTDEISLRGEELDASTSRRQGVSRRTCAFVLDPGNVTIRFRSL